MSEDLREQRVREVMDIFNEYEQRGLPVWVSADGTTFKEEAEARAGRLQVA
jgi:hypothetical protein